MKNFFKSLAICALAALTFASCQKENADGNMDDQSSVVSINLTSPLMGTKAFAMVTLLIPCMCTFTRWMQAEISLTLLLPQVLLPKR